MDRGVLGTALTASEYKETCLKIAEYHAKWSKAWHVNSWINAACTVTCVFWEEPGYAVMSAALTVLTDLLKDRHQDQSVQWRTIEQLIV